MSEAFLPVGSPVLTSTNAPAGQNLVDGFTDTTTQSGNAVTIADVGSGQANTSNSLSNICRVICIDGCGLA